MNSAITITLYTAYSSRIYNITECRKNRWRFMHNKKYKKRIAMTEMHSLILFKQRQWRLKANKETVTKE